MLFPKNKDTLDREKSKRNNLILEVIEELETENIDLLKNLNSISEISYYTKLVKDDEKEIDFLKKCYEIDEKGYNKFYSSNWPKGFRYESMNFYWNYSFVIKEEERIIKTFYTIEVEEDMDLIGQRYKKVPEIKLKTQNALIIPKSFDYKVYIELLKMKFKIMILNEILEGKNSCVHIGVEYLDYNGSSRMRKFDLFKKRIILIIENSDLINLKISFQKKIYKLNDILIFFSIETGKKEPWEIFLMFSERDLLILSKVIDKIEQNIEYKEKIPYEI